MNIKYRLTILNFLEFFVLGTWLLSAGAYMSTSLNFSGLQIGAVYATLGIASIFMPPLMGIIADKFINAEKLFGLSHFVIAGLFVLLTRVSDYHSFYMIMLFISMFYMPTLALNNSISYYNLEKEKYDVVKDFPPIRVWGTIGFILAAWTIDIMGWKVSREQFYLGAVASIILGIYSFTVPKVPVSMSKNKSFIQLLGLDAFVLFKRKNLAIFLIFSMLLGAALQITNIWGVPFLNDFEIGYRDSFVVKHSVFLMTISQISETLFILTIPFFLSRFGIKKVMLMSLFAWVFRFGFFGIGNPEGIGLVFLVLSMLIYGMAFDFFNVSGSIFIDNEVSPDIRSSAQGLFLMMPSGFGSIIGGYGSGLVVDLFTYEIRNWQWIWFSFAIYALIIGLLFAVMFKYKHTPKFKTK